MREIENEVGMDSEVVLRRLYGRALEPETGKELARSLGEWRGLEAADRTFVLAHLARLQLEVLERVLEVVGEGADFGDDVRAGDASDDLVEDEATEEVARAAGPPCSSDQSPLTLARGDRSLTAIGKREREFDTVRTAGLPSEADSVSLKGGYATRAS